MCSSFVYICSIQCVPKEVHDKNQNGQRHTLLPAAVYINGFWSSFVRYNFTIVKL